MGEGAAPGDHTQQAQTRQPAGTHCCCPVLLHKSPLTWKTGQLMKYLLNFSPSRVAEVTTSFNGFSLRRAEGKSNTSCSIENTVYDKPASAASLCFCQTEGDANSGNLRFSILFEVSVHCSQHTTLHLCCTSSWSSHNQTCMPTHPNPHAQIETHLRCTSSLRRPKRMSVLRLRSCASSSTSTEYWLSWASSRHSRSSVPSASSGQDVQGAAGEADRCPCSPC